jgi:hypothetical protein
MDRELARGLMDGELACGLDNELACGKALSFVWGHRAAQRLK